MNKKIIETVNTIDKFIRQHSWFDLYMYSFVNQKLVIAGGYDITSYHSLEVIFEDVFFFSGIVEGWNSDTDDSVFQILINEMALYQKYEIEKEYHLFSFKPNNYKNEILIAAKNVSYNLDTVFYYNKSNLQENERIAHFVKTSEQ